MICSVGVVWPCWGIYISELFLGQCAVPQFECLGKRLLAQQVQTISTPLSIELHLADLLLGFLLVLLRRIKQCTLLQTNF